MGFVIVFNVLLFIRAQSNPSKREAVPSCGSTCGLLRLGTAHINRQQGIDVVALSALVKLSGLFLNRLKKNRPQEDCNGRAGPKGILRQLSQHWTLAICAVLPNLSSIHSYIVQLPTSSNLKNNLASSRLRVIPALTNYSDTASAISHGNLELFVAYPLL